MSHFLAPQLRLLWQLDLYFVKTGAITRSSSRRDTHTSLSKNKLPSLQISVYGRNGFGSSEEDRQ